MNGADDPKKWAIATQMKAALMEKGSAERTDLMLYSTDSISDLGSLLPPVKFRSYNEKMWDCLTDGRASDVFGLAFNHMKGVCDHSYRKVFKDGVMRGNLYSQYNPAWHV